MANKTSRALRRHHRQRMINRAKRYYKQQHQLLQFYSGKQLDNYCSQWGDTLKMCSCWMCGNPRNHKNSDQEKLTLQEHRNNDRFNQQLNDIVY